MTDDNRCQHCAHPSDNGHHYAVRVRGDWHWGCGDSFRADDCDDAIKVRHLMTEAEIRDLDQEARDREEMIELLMSLDAVVEDGDLAAIEGGFNAFDEKRTALLKRLGRLP